MTAGEQPGRGAEPLVERILAGEELQPADGSPELRGYVDLALRGGFPEAVFAASDRTHSC